ncbi:hypothetical protein QL285_035899 [Trifolium repens]|nr:hypothetical protein QL285_035899 [Trifolium repens]
MIALTILCLVSAISQKSHPSVFGLEMSPSNIFHKRIIPSVSGPEMSSSNIFQVAGFANNQSTNLHLISPKKIISSVYGQADNTFSYCVLLSYIDSRQYLHFMSCSPTLTADNVFISCLALPH